MVSQESLTRLSLIKFLYQSAVKQAELPEPMYALSVLALHDAAELFLQVLTQQYGVAKGDWAFMAFWDALKDAVPGGLGMREELRRLNSARVALKHSGVLPSRTQVQQLALALGAFFAENVPKAFDGLQFDEISLASFVQHDQVRQAVERAQLYAKAGELKKAQEEVAKAFRLLVVDHKHRMSALTLLDYPFSEPADLATIHGSDFELDRALFDDPDDPLPGTRMRDLGRKLGEFVDEVKRALSDLREANLTLALGVDYREYFRFMSLTPRLYERWGREEQEVPDLDVIWHGPQEVQPPREVDVEFCIEFVLKSALAFQEFWSKSRGLVS